MAVYNCFNNIVLLHSKLSLFQELLNHNVERIINTENKSFRITIKHNSFFQSRIRYLLIADGDGIPHETSSIPLMLRNS